MLESGKRRIAVNDIELSVEIRGAGPPLLFTTPGWGASIEAYRHLRPMEERFTVIWVETRGTGKSSAPIDDDYRLSQFAADAEGVRHALGIERWWVAGHSFGGVLAQDYMSHHPDRCLGAILLCTMVALDPLNFEDILERGMARAGEPGCDDALAAFPRPVTSDDEAIAKLADIIPLYFRDLATAERFLQECEGMSCRVKAMVAEQGQSIDRVSTEILPTLNVPTIVLAASDDFICSPPKNLQVHNLISGSKFVLVEKAGHFPWFENPGPFWFGLDNALASLAREVA